MRATILLIYIDLQMTLNSNLQMTLILFVTYSDNSI